MANPYNKVDKKSIYIKLYISITQLYIYILCNVDISNFSHITIRHQLMVGVDNIKVWYIK